MYLINDPFKYLFAYLDFLLTIFICRWICEIQNKPFVCFLFSWYLSNRALNRNYFEDRSGRYVQEIMVMWQTCSKKKWPFFTLSAKSFSLMFNFNLKTGVIHRCRKLLINISRSNIDAAYVSTKNREAKWTFKTLSALLQYKQHGKKITYQLSNIPLSNPNMRCQGLWKECTVIKNSQWRVQVMFHTT